MIFECFLSSDDSDRVTRTLGKLARHGLKQWALTGGLAVELHLSRLAGQPCTRLLNDIDFVADSFEFLPHTLVQDFLFRHVHPLAAAGKTMLQCVDTETALRVDIFNPYGAAMIRACPPDLPTCELRLISLEDLASGEASLLMDLAGNIPVDRKFARDFRRLSEFIHTTKAEIAWRDYRKPDHPATFSEAAQLVTQLIDSRADLLIAPEYSTDVSATCERCQHTPAFPLADARAICAVLGYC